jgi:hypothetical protein
MWAEQPHLMMNDEVLGLAQSSYDCARLHLRFLDTYATYDRCHPSRRGGSFLLFYSTSAMLWLATFTYLWNIPLSNH